MDFFFAEYIGVIVRLSSCVTLDYSVHASVENPCFFTNSRDRETADDEADERLVRRV